MGSLSRQRGVSLIEVLVAVVIFSIGVLGVALMQLKSAQFTKQAGSRTVAVVQARSLADAMRANPAGVYGVANQSLIPAQNGVLTSSYYVYNGASAPDPSTCSGANVPCQQAKRDLLTWLAQLKASTVAPTSGGANTAVLASVQVNTNTGTLTIQSSWNGLIQNTSGATTNDTYAFDYQP